MFPSTSQFKPAVVLLLAATILFASAPLEAQSLGATANQPAPVPQPAVQSWHFDNVAAGQIPAGWVVAATNQSGPLATWRVVNDASAPSGGRALELTTVNHHSGGTFNLCWNNNVSFLDGEIRVRFKANTGREDQGGGVIWRARDKDNYYIARFNPLEDNFRLYSVHEGSRRMLASARIKLTSGQWHSMKIVQQGTRFQGYLDGQKLLAGTDDLFQEPGGVGLWTKADAATSFDDFSVQEPKMKSQ